MHFSDPAREMAAVDLAAKGISLARLMLWPSCFQRPECGEGSRGAEPIRCGRTATSRSCSVEANLAQHVEPRRMLDQRFADLACIHRKERHGNAGRPVRDRENDATVGVLGA